MATLTAGSRYGYMLVWAIVVGVIMKILLVEGVGRYYLSTGKTIFQGWRTLGSWTSWYFGPYILIWDIVYGATAMSSTALPLAALFPAIDLKVFAIAAGLIGLILVWLDRYQLIEKLMMVLIGIMFVTVLLSAALTVPNLADLAAGLIPRLPTEEGGMFYVLALTGGVGGTITLAAYGYWLREKGWSKPKWMRVMRFDNATAYVLSGIFVFGTMIMGVELLYSAGLAISAGDDGLLDISTVLADRYGDAWSVVFLIGFFAASFSSLLGVWHGVSLMFADFWVNFRRPADELDQDDAPTLQSRPARFYMLMLTFPTMALLFLNNQKRFVPKQFQNKWFHNVMLGINAGVFVAAGANELYEALAPLWNGG